ncbi:MAG: DUF2961 domain-containing protein [Myxococcota bacterium]|nr:DUF2961 domain-containing protein [Myxococcota bacterium]
MSQAPFRGLGTHLGNLSRLSSARTRSVSPENPSGGKGEGAREEPAGNHHARALGRGWKVRPSIEIAPSETALLADICGPGAVQQIWMTLRGMARFAILRVYWDDSELPAVECPVADFFASAFAEFAQVSSLAVCVNPSRGFNCYWEMPFRKRCRITLENLSDTPITLYYQINYALSDLPEDAAYFHAQFRRTNPLPEGEVHTLLDRVRGRGHYVGTYLAWGSNSPGWWGEGELKFYLDGDQEFPTICGTGTEDYFGGAWNFDAGGYRPFTGPYTGLPHVVRPDGLYKSQQRFGMYRWHIPDPIRFEQDVRVTVQGLGWRKDRFILLHDDISSVAYWYQELPTPRFPELPARNELELDE